MRYILLIALFFLFSCEEPSASYSHVAIEKSDIPKYFLINVDSRLVSTGSPKIIDKEEFLSDITTYYAEKLDDKYNKEQIGEFIRLFETDAYKTVNGFVKLDERYTKDDLSGAIKELKSMKLKGLFDDWVEFEQLHFDGVISFAKTYVQQTSN